jgi:hypothetical protein
MNNNTRHRIVAAASILCVAIAGSAMAQDPEKGLVNLKTNYGASGTISSVTGVSGVGGASDSIVVTFTRPMHTGNFGMGTNFAKSWTKTWNDASNVLTIGGDIDLSDATEPTLIVYLMQKEADRKDISEPNIFKFRDITVTGTHSGNGQVNVDFDILSADGKGYSVYLAKANESRFKRHTQVNFNSKGVHIKGLEKGQTYQVYVEYKRDGLVATKTVPVTVTTS